jgi:hypothetical protein
MLFVKFAVCLVTFAKHSLCVVDVEVVAAHCLCFVGGFVSAIKLFLCHAVAL